MKPLDNLMHKALTQLAIRSNDNLNISNCRGWWYTTDSMIALAICRICNQCICDYWSGIREIKINDHGFQHLKDSNLLAFI